MAGGVTGAGTTASAASGTAVTCSTDPNIFNTGYDRASGGALPGGTDPSWEVAGPFGPTNPLPAAAPPPAGATWGPANVARITPVWDPSPYDNAQWISQQTTANPDQGVPRGDWYYRYQFTLDSVVDPGAFTLAMNFLADNTVTEVYVNGVPQSSKTTGLPSAPAGQDPYFFAGFKTPAAAQTTLNHDWRSGLNTMVVQVKSGQGAEGFLAQMRPSVLCPTLEVTKTVAGRASADDQFTVSVADSTGTVINSATTSGTGTTASSGATPVRAGATYTITDAMAAGAASRLSYYRPTITCTNTTTGQAVAATGSAPSWKFTVPTAGAFRCAVTNTATQAWNCDAFGYLFQTPSATSPNDIFQVDLATGAAKKILETPTPVNAVGFNTLDNYFYGFDNAGHLVRVNADGSLTDLGVPPGIADGENFNVGDFDSNGHLWVTRSVSPANWYEIDLVPGSPTYGRVVRSGSITTPGGLNSGADWSWIGGALYKVGSEAATGAPHLLKFDPVTGTESDAGRIVGMPDNPFIGATYADAAGYLYSSDNTTGDIYRTDPRTRQSILVSHGPASGGNDGARCASAPIPTITVEKQVAGRVQAADQFTVGLLAGGGTQLTAATTTGTNTSASTANWPVTQGATYTITDAMAPGSPDAISAYAATITCVDSTTGDPVPAGGNGPWTLTVSTTHNYKCTVTNTPGTPSYEVTKTAGTAGPVHPGDKVTYTVTVRNTGSVPYTAENPASFTDDLSAVLDDATYNNDATGGATVQGTTLSWSGPLAVGATVTVTYSVTVDNPVTGDQKLRNAVTGGTNCPPGATDPACAPPEIPVQSFRAVKTTDATAVTPGSVIHYTVTVTNTGIVDYPAGNPASFTDDLSAVLDDATYNNDADNGATYTAPTLSWSGPLAVGQSVEVHYSLTVNDPHTGDQRLANAVVTPPGTGGNCAAGSTDPACTTTTPSKSFSVTKSASQQDANPGDTITYTVVVTNTGQAAYPAEAPASFTDDLSGVLDDATYNNDATGGATYAEPVLSWSGPLAVGESVTVTYTVTVHNPDTGDKRLVNAVSNPPGTGGGCAPGSTDPACHNVVAVRSFSVAKKADPAEAGLGDTVTYTVTVTNTGQAAYTAQNPAGFIDDLSGVLDDATYNNDADNGATYTAPTLSWSGPLAVGQTVTVTYSVTVHKPGTGDHDLVNGVSAPPGVPGFTCADGSLAPCAPGHVPVSDYTVTKTASAAQAGTGEKVTYTVTVTNTGRTGYTAANPATFTDDLSGVLDDATYNDDATNGATVDRNTLSWSGPLAVGQSVTVTYSVTVNAPSTGDHHLRNAVTGGGNCPPGADAAACRTDTPVASYTVAKSASAEKALPGDTITYTMTVTNTGQADYTAENPAAFSDNLAAVLDDATYNNDATNGAQYVAPVLSWSGPLAVGQTVTVTYSVTVGNPDSGDHQLTNAPVLPDVPGAGCADGTPGPCDPVQTPVQSYDVVKTVDKTKAAAGDKLTYTVTVTNTGKVDYPAGAPASFTDDLSAVLDDATYNNDATGGATYAEPVLSWSGPLAVGQAVTVTYSVTVHSPDTGDQKLGNTVVTPAGGGSCPAGTTNPQCTANVPGNQLKVTKTTSSATAAPGEKVTYTVTVTNTGQADFTAQDPASFTDDLSAVLDDATYNGDATGGATVDGTTLSWSGPLPAGQSVTVTYSVTVHDPDTGDRLLDNKVVTPPGLNGNCTTGSTDPDCGTRTSVRSFEVVKHASTGHAGPGGKVTYTVTVTNTGQVAYTADKPASFTDDLSAVLDDATYNGDATGGATVDGTTLSWSGPLAVGGTTTVTYSVTVNDPARGDGNLHNVVVTPPGSGGFNPGGNCAAGADNPDCRTDTAVDTPAGPGKPGAPGASGGGKLATTGDNTWLQLLVAGILLALGGALLTVIRVRRRHG
ncbi:DUF7927 domain-containing protein [Amycolatopsis viridis]|uniref:Repeat protein (TIGR01451 family) n=1 Tax=Amycolatopsis viridis TaxID=185678 RepID=A0ABX0SVM2_9PSEU|nr:DUF11 domain-containing protein [Amycolatopsis viridis]NIH80978.1 putative repeat protein (TIGR01451 family) [Amycolatopsis viridis]